jgi:protein-S-isoprenylcysteine O-methyltransferase Ste14
LKMIIRIILWDLSLSCYNKLMDNKIRLTKAGISTFISPFIWLLIVGFIYFAAAGDVKIPRAWIYIATYAFGSLAGNLLLVKKVPELLNQRSNIHRKAEKWDIIILYAYFFLTLTFLPLTAGLDFRFHISPLPFTSIYIGITFILASLFLLIWAMLCNRFFEPSVRIQNEKKHVVIQTGPYSIIRHPGNLGVIIGSLPIPFALGSLLSMIPAAIMISLIVIRTKKEDEVLLTNLPGYGEYVNKVKYRLIPYIW